MTPPPRRMSRSAERAGTAGMLVGVLLASLVLRLTTDLGFFSRLPVVVLAGLVLAAAAAAMVGRRERGGPKA